MDFNGLNRCFFFTITHTSVRFNTILRKISEIYEICVSPKKPVRFNIRRAKSVRSVGSV